MNDLATKSDVRKTTHPERTRLRELAMAAASGLAGLWFQKNESDEWIAKRAWARARAVWEWELGEPDPKSRRKFPPAAEPEDRGAFMRQFSVELVRGAGKMSHVMNMSDAQVAKRIWGAARAMLEFEPTE